MWRQIFIKEQSETTCYNSSSKEETIALKIMQNLLILMSFHFETEIKANVHIPE